MKYFIIPFLMSMSFLSQAGNYQIFATKNDAINFLKAQQNKEDDEVIFSKLTDPAYKKAEAILKQTVEAHVLLDPTLKDLPIPQILLVDSPDATAESAGFNSKLNQATFAILMDKKFTNDPKAMQAVLAHELSHVYKLHGKSKDIRDQSRWSIQDSNGSSHPLNTVEYQKAFTWFLAQQRVGITRNDIFENLPSPELIDDAYTDVLEEFFTRYEDATCKQGKKLFDDWKTQTDQVLNQTYRRYDVPEKFHSAFIEWSKAVNEELSECLKYKKPIPYKDLLIQSWNIKPVDESIYFDQMNEIEKKNFEEDQTVFESDSNMFMGFSSLMKLNIDRLRTVESSLDMTRVRINSNEDEADILAIRALAKINVGPKSLNEFLTKDDSCPAFGISEEPEYGILIDPHHSDCWRAWRNQKLSLELK
jgi:hypothetical protein